MNKYKHFYEKIYENPINLIGLRKQKFISPAKRMKRQIVEKELKSMKKNSKILEIGCGLGDMIGFLNFKDKIGIDISSNAINNAKNLFPNTQFYVGDYNQTGSMLKGFYLRDGARYLWEANRIK